jgi:zeaxanthin glucosyltransferase
MNGAYTEDFHKCNSGSDLEDEKVQTKKILILVWSETSAYNATFRLARVLSQRGHKVIYAVPARWQDHIARQGFQTVCLDVPLRLSSASTDWWRNIVTGQAEAYQQIQDLCESLAWIASDEYALVLLYATLWHYSLVLHRFDIPYILINPCLAAVWSLEIPPIFSSLRPLRHRLFNRIQCAIAWFMLRYFGAFNHRYRGIIQPNRSDGLAQIRDIGTMAKHFFSSVFERFHMPGHYQLMQIARQDGIEIGWGDYGHRLVGPELVLGPQVIDFPRRTSQHTRLYVGACVDTERVEDSFDWSRVDDDRPIVYCAVGSHGGYWNAENSFRLTESVIEAFKTHPELQLLLQITDENVRGRLEPLPDNILAASWFPQLQVLSRASLMISHGGFGTVREALFYGVPMIIFPRGVDQPGNAARVTWSRVGLMGDIRSVTPASISAMVETIEKKRYRDNAMKLSESLQIENTCDDAVALIEASALEVQKAG